MLGNERKLQIRVFVKLLCVCVFALLYAWSGMEMKWLRRFVAPAWLGLCMFYFSGWDWRVFIQVPFLILGLHLGYGAETVGAKLARRALVGLTLAGSNLSHALDKDFSKRRFWGVFGLALLTIPVVHIYLGVINPISARAEETIIGFMVGLASMFIIKEKADAN